MEWAPTPDQAEYISILQAALGRLAAL